MSTSPVTTPNQVLRPSKAPVATGLLPFLGVVWSVALLVLGLIGIRDALVYAGAIGGTAWIERVAADLDGQRAADWLAVAGVVAVLLGLWLLSIAVKPRATNELAINAGTGVFLTKPGLRRVVKAAVTGVDGVDTATVSVRRSRVRVVASSWSDDDPEATRRRIEDRLEHQLSTLQRPPSVRVRVEPAGGSR